MDTATPHCELLNTYNLNNHTGDELSFEKGIRTLWLKDCRREKGCGRVWISRGLIRRKLSEKVLPPPTPQLTVSYSLTVNAFRLTPRCICASGFDHKQRGSAAGVGVAFSPKGSFGSSDQLRGKRTFALTACSSIMRCLGIPWLCIPIRTQFKVWSWMFTDLFAFGQTYSGTDNYISWSFLIPFFQEGQEYWVMNPGPVELTRG